MSDQDRPANPTTETFRTSLIIAGSSMVKQPRNHPGQTSRCRKKSPEIIAAPIGNYRLAEPA
ncbi:TPA: hypothetical protein EYN98_11810 [Candidatus Poribacteria bacterium]|nr:hypothetical protein [Candidatus Poribacteria bacterium]